MNTTITIKRNDEYQYNHKENDEHHYNYQENDEYHYNYKENDIIIVVFIVPLYNYSGVHRSLYNYISIHCSSL
jgi:FMN-dependent NADH-azoreductase